MAVTRIGPKHQITIPHEAFEKLGLQAGDLLEVEVGPEGLVLVPQKLIPRDQAWFWTDDWQAREREASEAIAADELSGKFDSAEELVKYLRGR